MNLIMQESLISRYMHFHIQSTCSYIMDLNNRNLKIYELRHIEITKLLFPTSLRDKVEMESCVKFIQFLLSNGWNYATSRHN